MSSSRCVAEGNKKHFKHTNSGANYDTPQRYNFERTWEELADVSKEDEEYVAIALKLAEEWGYPPTSRQVETYNLSNLNYECSFANGDHALMLGIEGGLWDCKILHS